MTLNLTYGSANFLKVINIDYDDAAHSVLGGSVGVTDIPSGIGQGVEFYRQDGTGEYWSVRALNIYPYASVVHVSLSLAEDLTIDSVDIVNQIGSTLGTVTVTASGTGTKRYKLGSSAIQSSNVFTLLYAGTYLLTLSRTEDGYIVTQNVTITLSPDLEITVTSSNCSANAIDDGSYTLTITNGSGDYSVNYITESVTNDTLNNTNNTETRSALAPDTYVIEVTDNGTSQVRTATVIIIYPAIVASTVIGTVFRVPMVNSIPFVIEDTNDQQLDNVLFCNQIHKGYEDDCYLNPYNITDKPRVQFHSNYLTHIIKMFKLSDDSEVKQFAVELTEENVGTTIDYSIVIKDYGVADQSKIYFQSGTIPIPLAIGNTFEISNNADGMDGIYAILNILIEASTGLSILVINCTYVGGTSSTATGTFDNQLSDYNVFESTLDFSDVDAGKYYFKILASDPADIEAISEPIDLKTLHIGTHAIVYSNTDNDFGTVWSTGYRGLVRVYSSMFKRVPGGERSVTRNSNDSLVKIRARKRRLVDFETDLLPPYMHEKLSVIFDTDYFSINGLAYQASDGYDDPQYTERSRLSLSKIRLEQLNWFGTFKSNKDMPSTIESCVCDTVDLITVSSSPSTINLNMGNKLQRIFKVTPSISAEKTFALLNDTLALSFKIMFEIADLVDINFPSDFISPDAAWTAGQVWTPLDLGKYEAECAFDGSNWIVKITGPNV